jgi:hypothetical protein
MVTAVSAQIRRSAVHDSVRRRRRVLVVLTTLAATAVSLLLAPIAPAMASSTPMATRVGLAVVPTGPIPSPGQASLIASVTPTDAAGRVFFSIRRNATTPVSLNAVVSAGRAQVDKVGFSRDGRYEIVAQFVPDDPSAFDESGSAPRVLVVSPTPVLRLFTTSGVEVTANTVVAPREQLLARLSGFPARTRVTLRWDRKVLVPRVPVDGDGAGTAILTLPVRLGGGRHVLSAIVGQVRTAVVLLTNRPVSTISTRVGKPETDIPDTGTGEPTVQVPSSGGGSLAHTGANPVPLASAAGALLMLGATMVLIGRTPRRPTGRHCLVRASS